MRAKRAGCLRCRDLGQRPKYEKPLPMVVFYAPISMPGPPTLVGHRLSAEMLADYVLLDGLDETAKDYQVSRAELLVVCWWAGNYGPKRFKQWWGEWSEGAYSHLWHSCVRIADPPLKGRS